MAGRLYVSIEPADVQPDDVVGWRDRHVHHNKVKAVSKKTVTIQNHPNLKPTTKRVNRSQVIECWRWHKKVEKTA